MQSRADTPKKKFFVEAFPLVEERPSGVAHSIVGLVSALAQNKQFTAEYEIVLIAPYKRLPMLDRWPGLKSCTRKGLYIKARIMRGLMKFHLLPPLDLLFGRGVYLFGNFQNWPTTKKSVSFTYIHDIAYVLFPETVAPRNQRALETKGPGFIAQSDYVVTVSQSSRKEILDYYKLPDEKVITLYNGMDTRNYRKHTVAEIAKAKKKYGITQDYFIFIGNIEPRKNLKRLVQAFRQMPHNLSLVLIGGSGWLNEDVLAEIDDARKAGVSIIKPQTFVPDEDCGILASGALALVQPSIHEGFGMPAAEGLASEVPVLVSDTPALREVAGEAGIYFDPYNIDDIASALKKATKLTAAQRKSLAKKGIIQIEQFSWDKAATKLTTILSQNRVAAELTEKDDA